MNDPRWQSVMNRDPAADGVVWFAVTTTGIYCRATCPARRPRPENAKLFDDPAAARAAGYRPCRRCDPDAPTSEAGNAALIERACRTLQQSDPLPDVADLAEAAGLSQGHFQRVFKKMTGLTPRAYAAAVKAERLKQALDKGESVTAAIYQAGYGSTSRAYDGRPLGMAPKTYRQRGRGLTLQTAIGPCSLGLVLIAASPTGVAAILLGDTASQLQADLARRFPLAEIIPDDQNCQAMLTAVIAMVDDPKRGLDLPLDLRGTTFQMRVWQALRAIPPGTTIDYTTLAERIGQSGSVRAVASACAANPLAVAVPCHRVRRRSGDLAGYRWGIDRKRTLLERESQDG